MIKRGPRVGPPSVGGTERGLFIKRVISWSANGFHWLADTAHIEKVIAYNGRADREAPSRKISPGSKHVGKSRKDAADLLGETERAECRHLAPLAHYVTADRPDIQCATGLLMRTLEDPTVL